MKNTQEKDYSKLFWYLLNILGISLNNNSYRRRSCRLITLFLFICINLSVGIIATIRFYILNNQTFILLCNLVLFSSIFLMTISFFSQRKTLTKIRKVIMQFPNRFKTKEVYLFIYLILFVTFAFPAVISFIYIKSKEHDDALTFVEFQDKGYLKTIFSFVMITWLNFGQMTVPAWINCIVWGYCQSWWEILYSLNIQIQSCGREYYADRTSTARLTILFQECRVLWKGTRLLRTTFSNTLLFLTMMQLVTLLLVASFSILDISQADNFIKVRTVYYLLGNCIFFVGMVFLANKIPEEMEKIAVSTKQLYGNLIFRDGSLKDKFMHDMLQFMISERPIRLTVGGFVDVKKNLILAACGSLVTYGVIVLQGDVF